MDSQKWIYTIHTYLNILCGKKYYPQIETPLLVKDLKDLLDEFI